MRRGLAAAAGALVLLTLVVLVRTGGLSPPAPPRSPATEGPVEGDAAIARFAEALRIPTVSHAADSDEPFPRDAFLAFGAFLERSYPAVHAALEVERISDYSRLYTWRGSDPALDPVVLMAHYDVVPADPASLDQWTHPPFSGAVADGFVWGRGAIDDKQSAIGLMEAAERLASAGFAPGRTIHLFLGHDEELGGKAGAAVAAGRLEERGVRAALVVDEGGAVIEGGFPGLDLDVAAVGIAEKGYLSLELSVDTAGGHSSAPPSHTAVGILAAAVTRLEGSPLPGRLDGPTRELLESIAPHAPFALRLVLRNLWLFGPVVEQALLRVDATAPLVHTTTAVTIFESGVKDNVLPSRGRVVVNFRIHPEDSIDSVVAHARRAIDDERISVTPIGIAKEPTPVSPTDSDAHALLEETIRQVFPETAVVPHLIPGGTDSRHFRAIATGVYGFVPARVSIDEVRRAHGNDERIPVDAYLDGIRFYAQLIRNAGAWR